MIGDRRHFTGRTQAMLWQRLASFQPRVQDIDLQFSRDRIRSPGSPTSSESIQLSELISNVEQDLSDYKEDIQIVENVLLDLKRKKGELERYVDHCKAYLSPIRRLPTEIMSEIFLIYQDLHWSDREDRQFREPLTRPVMAYSSPAMTALVLSSVCKLWYTITLATPQLWSRFSLQIRGKCGSLFHLLEIYLSRSKQHPLTFDVDVNGEGPIMRLLSAHSHRWFCTSGHCPGLNMQTDLPLLQSLEMAYGGAVSLDAFAGARTLRTVSLVGISRFLHSNLPWDQIQVLRARQLSTGDVGLPKYVWELAQKCPALRSLELDFSDYPPRETAGFTSSVHLGKLESLCLQYVMWYNVRELFCLSTLPSLRKLSLGVLGPYDDGPTPDIAVISSFISRSHCSISVLRFTNLRTSMAQIACGMLHHVPTLTELILQESTHSTFHVPAVMETLIAALRISPSPVEVDGHAGESKPALPLLRRLVMEVYADNFPASQFVDMLESRGMLAGGSLGALKLVRLFLQWSDGAEDFNLPLLQSLEAWPGVEIIASTCASRRYLRNEDSERWV